MGTPHDAAPLLVFARAILARHQPQITGHLPRSASTVKSTDVIKRGHERRGRDRTDARTGGQSLDDGIVGRQRGKMGVCLRQLLVEHFHHMVHRRQALPHGGGQVQGSQARHKSLGCRCRQVDRRPEAVQRKEGATHWKCPKTLRKLGRLASILRRGYRVHAGATKVDESLHPSAVYGCRMTPSLDVKSEIPVEWGGLNWTYI